MTNIRSAFLLLTANLVPVLAVEAQGGRHRSVQLPASGYVTATCGNLTGLGREDAVLIKDHCANFWHSVDTYSYVYQLSSTWLVNDLATLKAGGTTCGDRLLGIGPDGLTLAHIDQSGALTVATLEAGNWMNGGQVDCFGDTDAALVVGVASDQLTLGIGTIANLAFGASVWSNQRAVVKQAVLFDWDHDGVPEVAVLGPNSLRILDSSLTLLATFSGDGGAIARLRNVGCADELAWVRGAGNGTYELVVVSPLGCSSALQLALPLTGVTGQAFNLVGISTGDTDGDGRDDVAIAQNTTSEIVVLCRQTGSTPFALPSTSAPSAGFIRSYGSDPGAQGHLTGPALFDDFTAEGKADLVTASTPTGNTQVDLFREGDDTGPQLWTNEDDTAFVAGQNAEGRLKLRFALPSTSLGYSYIQITSHSELVPLVNGVPNGNGATSLYANRYHELARDSNGLLLPVQEIVLGMRNDPVIRLNESIWSFLYQSTQVQPHLWLEVRYLNLQGGQESNWSGWTRFGVTLQNTAGPLDGGWDLSTLPSWLDHLLLGQWQDTGDQGVPGNIRGRAPIIGGIVPVTNIPKEGAPDGSLQEGSKAQAPTSNNS